MNPPLFCISGLPAIMAFIRISFISLYADVSDETYSTDTTWALIGPRSSSRAYIFHPSAGASRSFVKPKAALNFSSIAASPEGMQ